LTVTHFDASTIASGNIVQWDWDFGDANTSTATNPIHSYSTVGVYLVQLVVTSDLGCIDTVVIPDTIVFIQADFVADTVCEGVVTTFTDSSQAFGFDTIISWDWDFGDLSTATTQMPTHTYASSGTYTVILEVQSIQGYSDTMIQDVVVNPNPSADYSMEPLRATILQPIQFSDLSTGSPTVWIWDFGDGIGASNQQNPSYTYTRSGLTTVLLEVRNQFGCRDTATIDRFIENIYPPVIPLTFTPNDDGNNDFVWVRGGPFKSMVIKIYNEWGELIFETADPLNPWDGTKNGVPQPIGVYVYLVNAVTLNDLVYEIYGDISLIR